MQTPYFKHIAQKDWWPTTYKMCWKMKQMLRMAKAKKNGFNVKCWRWVIIVYFKFISREKKHCNESCELTAWPTEHNMNYPAHKNCICPTLQTNSNYEFYCSPNISIKFIIVLMANVMERKQTEKKPTTTKNETNSKYFWCTWTYKLWKKKLNNCTTTWKGTTYIQKTIIEGNINLWRSTVCFNVSLLFFY